MGKSNFTQKHRPVEDLLSTMLDVCSSVLCTAKNCNKNKTHGPTQDGKGGRTVRAQAGTELGQGHVEI